MHPVHPLGQHRPSVGQHPDWLDLIFPDLCTKIKTLNSERSGSPNQVSCSGCCSTSFNCNETCQWDRIPCCGRQQATQLENFNSNKHIDITVLPQSLAETYHCSALRHLHPIQIHLILIFALLQLQP